MFSPSEHVITASPENGFHWPANGDVGHGGAASMPESIGQAGCVGEAPLGLPVYSHCAGPQQYWRTGQSGTGEQSVLAS